MKISTLFIAAPPCVSLLLQAPTVLSSAFRLGGYGKLKIELRTDSATRLIANSIPDVKLPFYWAKTHKIP
jgi:hypothetical protein